MAIVAAEAMVVKFKIQVVMPKAREWGLMRHERMDIMSGLYLRGRQGPQSGRVGKKLDGLVQGRVVSAAHARVGTGDE